MSFSKKIYRTAEEWKIIFQTPPKEDSMLKNYFIEIGKKINDNPNNIKAAYYRHLDNLERNIIEQKPSYPVNADFTTFSSKYQMPDGLDESKPPFILDCKKLWVGGDFHFPFHDKQAIMTALGQAEGCDVILLNGDVMDCYAESRFIKNPIHRMLHDELNLVRDFLEYLRSRFKKARILYKFGNHDKRHQDYIYKQAEVLTGLDDVLLPKLLRFEMHGIEEIHHTQLIRAGKLNIIHGHEFGGGASTINVGRSLLLKAFDNIMFNHWHVENSYPVRKINQDVIAAWGVACLCKLRPDYRPFNGWVNGFATVEFEGEFFHVENKKIMNGKIF